MNAVLHKSSRSSHHALNELPGTPPPQVTPGPPMTLGKQSDELRCAACLPLPSNVSELCGYEEMQ